MCENTQPKAAEGSVQQGFHCSCCARNENLAIAGANKTISGNLTLLRKTLNVSFPAKVTVAEGKASIEAKFTVNRADWGIKFGTDETDPAEWMISKDIEIGINVNASK